MTWLSLLWVHTTGEPWTAIGECGRLEQEEPRDYITHHGRGKQEKRRDGGERGRVRRSPSTVIQRTQLAHALRQERLQHRWNGQGGARQSLTKT